jgi:mycothiol synthase
MSDDARFETSEHLTPEQIDEVVALIDRVTAVDNVRPLSEHVMLHVRYGGDVGTGHLLLRRGEALAGYAHLDDGDGTVNVELAAPERPSLEALIGAVVDRHGDGLRVWAHGKQSNAAAVLRARGFREVRVLLQMRRSLDAELPEPRWPERVSVRTFEVGRDEAAWLAVNNAAFADHPDQSGWTLDDVTAREREPWFDPDGFFLAERDGALVGFHWTKVHGSDPASNHGHEPIGEVYVVGVSPAMQGQHLGTALTLAGLIHLRKRGLPSAMLYVDETNRAAVALYERLGFRPSDADICFEPGRHGAP